MNGFRETTGRDLALLAGILLLALGLRIWGLNSPLWYDEILTLENHLRMPWGQMLRDYSMNHHYFYDFQAKAVMVWFGDAPWVVRLPAMLFGVASIGLMWVLARDIAGVGIAHLVAMLLAISFHHIWFSQNARGYSELAFWSTLGLICFLRGLQEPRWGLWIGFGLTLAAATFTHLTGAFFYAALGLVWVAVLVRRGVGGGLFVRPLVGAALGVAITAVVYLPLLPSLLVTVGGVAETSAVDVMKEYQNPVWTVIEAVDTAAGGVGGLVDLLAVGIVSLSLIGGVASARKSPWFGWAVLAHIGLTVVVLMALGMRIWPRFFFVDIGFLMLLIVLGVRQVCVWVGRAIRRPGWVDGGFAVAAVAMVAVSCLMAVRNYQAPKQDLPGAVALVEGLRQTGEPVYAVGPGNEVFTSHFKLDWQPLTNVAGYAAVRAQPGPALFVLVFPERILREYPAIEADRQSGALADVRWLPGTLGDGYVLVLQRP